VLRLEMAVTFTSIVQNMWTENCKNCWIPTSS
jgi:hypothetical protein